MTKLPETLRLPIDWLAVTFALWEPIRKWTPRRRAAVLWESRTDFEQFGIPVKVGGADDERKSGERRITDLEDANLITTARTNGRRTHVKLTTAADERLRALVGLEGIADTLAAMQKLQAALNDGLDLGGIVLENVLTGEKWADTDTTKRLALENDLNPALVRGWVTSHTTTAGMVWYALTKQGRNALATAKPDEQLPERDPDAAGHFLGSLKLARAAIDKAKPRHPNELGFMPLPATLWAYNDKLDAVIL